MNSRPPLAWLATLLGLLICAAPTLGDDDDKHKLINQHFPLKVGSRWIYRLRVSASKKTQRIEYTTRVVRKEDVTGLGPCFVTEARSIDKLFTTEYYQLEGGKLFNPRRLEGGQTAEFKGRVLLSEAVLAELRKKEKDRKPVDWAWVSEDERAKGTVRITGRETIHLRNYSNLDCVVLKDTGEFTFKKGTVRRVQERTIWLAPGIGMVKEFMQIKTEKGEVVFETEAKLKHYDES